MRPPRLYGVPFQRPGVMSLIVAALLVIASPGDLRTIASGFLSAVRAWRAIWANCFQFIAAGSFLSVRERVGQLRAADDGALRALPIVLFLHDFYGLSSAAAAHCGPRRHDSAPAAPRANDVAHPVEHGLILVSGSRAKPGGSVSTGLAQGVERTAGRHAVSGRARQQGHDQIQQRDAGVHALVTCTDSEELRLDQVATALANRWPQTMPTAPA